MQLSITARHMDLSEDLKEYAEKKVYGLKKYFNHILDAQLVLEQLKTNRIAELTLHANGLTAHAEDCGVDLRGCLDSVVEKIEKQLKKHHSRLKNHRTRSSISEENQQFDYRVLGGEEATDEEPQIIRSERFAIKPMSLDEAALQMDLMNQDFLVFQNHRTHVVNVLYRRRDGHYGLVEPGSGSD